ncbi:hypothetical protein [Bradyrhizobium liaoningense]|uniref:hypothetical protein n=1 Tax=Bradyrhizobium liaoningense TaxID=43992 RepID=UPI001BACCF75|nr:hypothetical protein [Bradyrhizobium liaoningense]MBR0716037.1 hypothetical protein [Bradyrhizobium liaoningense]
MPILRYFVYVGGALLVLLFGVNLVLPQAAHVETVASEASISDAPMIRIRSERKLPERVVLDTSQPTVVPVKTAEVTASNQPAQTSQSQALADLSAKARVRDTFAQFTPEPKADAAAGKKGEVKPQVAQAAPQSAPSPKHKVARSRSMQPQYYGQQYYGPQYGYYGPQYGRPMRVAQQPHFGLFNNTW